MLLYISEKFIEKNDIIWDIGANVGLFSFTSIIKSSTGKCLSFEPDIWLCNLLRKSANQNPDLDVQILPLAVSEEIGFVTFNIANRSRATNFISKATGSSQTGGTRTSYIVPTVTLNHVLKFNDAPQFIKIDTEGAELLILRGALDVLVHKPKILCEVSNETFGPVVDILNNFK